MILMIIVCVIHQILATNYVFQGSKDQVERYIYSSDCFDNYERREVDWEKHGFILARVDKAVGFIKPNCPQITFDLPTEIQYGKRARITINQTLPGDAEQIFLVNMLGLNQNRPRTDAGLLLFGCVFKGKSLRLREDERLAWHGGYFGRIADPPGDMTKGYQPQAKVAPAENVVSNPPVSCSFEVAVGYFKNMIETANHHWGMTSGDLPGEHAKLANKSSSIFNLHEVLFPKNPYPQDSLPMEKSDAYIGEDCDSSNVNCFFAPQCFESTGYEPNCPAKFIVQSNGDHVLITLESSRSDVKALRLRLEKYTPNEDLGQDSHSRRLMQFDCIFDRERQNGSSDDASSVVSNIKISSNPKICSFRIKLGNGREPRDIFDNTAWEMSFDSESYYQIIRPGMVHWKV